MSDQYNDPAGRSAMGSSSMWDSSTSETQTRPAAAACSTPLTNRTNQPLIPPRSALRTQVDAGRLRSNSHVATRPVDAASASTSLATPSPYPTAEGAQTPPSGGHSFSRSYSHTLGTPIVDSSMEPAADGRDVFAAVRGLRGDQTPVRARTPPLYDHSPMGELSFSPEGYLDGEKEVVSFSAGSQARYAENSEPESEEGAEDEVLGRIRDALARSSDHGDTLDLSRKGISAIGPLAVQQFRRGVGKEGKGVWRLALSYNRLDPFSIDPSFCLLSRLRYLNLKGNHLSQFPPPLSDMPSLEILDLSKNRISAFPVQPGRLVNLKVLSLTNNKLYALPEYIADFEGMTVFKVDNNPLEWPPKEVMGALMDVDQPLPRDASARSKEKQREADLQPWIANMKRWIRERVAEAHAREDAAEAREDQATPTSADFFGSDASRSAHVAEPARMQAFTFGQAAPSPSVQNTVRAIRPLADVEHARTGSTESQGRERQASKPPPLRLVTSHAREPSQISLPSATSSASTHSRQPSSINSVQFQAPTASGSSGHSRGSSLTTQRLSGPLSSKKSLPDLRKSHAQIMQDRRESGTSPAVPIRMTGDRTPHSAISVPSLSPWSPLLPSPATAGRSADSGRKRLPRVGSADMLSRMRPNGGGLPPVTEQNSQEGPPVDDSRNSYFRRLSTLPPSTISKTIPETLLSFVDGIRGILFALSQLHSALKQYLLFAANDRVAGLFSRVMDAAGAQTTALINALDRFDSMSRRSLPPPTAVKSVVDTTKSSIAAFAKVVAMLQLQMPALQTADTRYTRTLLLIVYGSMSEISYSWTTMTPMLRRTKSPAPAESASQPKKSHRHLALGSFGGRTPISPIPERGESHSPPAVNHAEISSRPTVQASPLKTSMSTSDLALSATPSVDRYGSGSRRQAGSFSIQDVERGMLMSRSALGSARSPVKAGHQATDSLQSTLSSLVSTEVSESENALADEDDIYNLPPNPPFAYRANKSNGSSINLPQTPPDTHLALQPIAMVPVNSGTPARRHQTTSSAGSSNINLAGYGKGRNTSVDLPGSAATFDVDDDLLDVIEAATDVAFTAWLKLAEDIGGVPNGSRHMRSGSTSTDPRSARPATISPKDHSTMLDLLSTSETVTTQLRESLMGIRADPHSETSMHARQALHAQSESFVKTVVQVTHLVMKLSAQHTFSAAVRQCCGKLVQFTREFAILFQVSHTRPGTSTSAYATSSHSQSQTSLLGHPYLAGNGRYQHDGSRSSSPVSSMTLTGARRRFAASSDNLAQPHSADGSQASSATAGTPRSAGLRGLRLPSRQAALGR